MSDELTKTAGRVPQAPASGLSLVVVGGGTIARHRLPPEGEVVLGRGDASIALAHDQVSRRHAILYIGDTLRLQDLGSKNGTRVCGRQLAANETVDIAPGDVVQLGSVVLVVQTTVDVGKPVSQAAFDERVTRACSDGQPFAVARLVIERAPPHYEEILADVCGSSDPIGERSDGCTLLLRDDAAAGTAIEKVIDRLRQAGASVQWGAAWFPRDGRDPDCLHAVIDAAFARGAPLRAPSFATTEPPMRDIYALAERAAQGTLTVLLAGETGVGKEVLAELIHRRSPRASGPYLCLNCAALPESMVESELFGHERGAFTGATRDKIGLFEAARGGTVLLDEIGELALPVQAKLLRVFEAKEVLRIGSVKARPIDVRFLAATNRDLDAEVEAGRFRKDLYFRLKGLVITIPPLRERRAELRRLAQVFVDAMCQMTGRRPPPSWSPEALALLDRYGWPGNVRELRNTVERALLLCTGGVIEPAHLPDEIAQPASSDDAKPPEPSGEAALRGKLDQLERARIEDALARCEGNQSQAAKLLGIARNTLIARLEAYGLARPRKKRE